MHLEARGSQTTRNRDTRRHPEGWGVGGEDPQRDVAGATEQCKMVAFICRGQEGTRKKSEVWMGSGSRDGVARALRRRTVDLHTTARVETRLESRRARLETHAFYSLGTLLLLEFIHTCWCFMVLSHH